MSSSLKLLLLTTLVLQNTVTALLGRFTRAVAEDDLYDIGQFILISELFKLAASVLLERAVTQSPPFSQTCNRYGRPGDLLKMSIPAVLYWASNTLLYVAISNLPVPTFQVLTQAKLVVTAVVSVLMLGSRYSCRQWACLAIISISLALIVLEEKKTTEDTAIKSTTQIFSLQSTPLVSGLVAVTLSSLFSAFAGVYFEKVLKTETNDSSSIWMRNIQLAFCSIIVALLQQFSRGERRDELGRNQPFLHGFTPLVWCQVFLFAGGGLLVSAVIKYADNVMKGLAIGISVLLSTVASMIFYNTPITLPFIAYGFATIAAVYFFSNDFPRPCVQRHSRTLSVQRHSKTLILLPGVMSVLSIMFSMKFLSVPFENKFQEEPLKTSNLLPPRTDLFPFDWNSTEEALSMLRSVQNRIEERGFHEATHILYDLRTHLGNRPVKYLEIGSYTGISSSFVMSHPFPTYATLIDPCVLPTQHFRGTLDQESTIRKNIASIVPNAGCNITRPWDLHVGFSPSALPDGETFDIIFIDGDHSTQGVWTDYNNTISLLRPGGFMVFDDYLDWKDSSDVRGAVDNIAKITDLIPIGSPRNIHGIHPQVNASFINEFIFQKPGKFEFSPLLTPGLEHFTPVLCVTVATYRRQDGSTPQMLERLWEMLQQQSYSNWKLYMTGDNYDNETEWRSLSFFNNSLVHMYNLPEPGERGKLTGKELWHNAGATAMNDAIDRVLADGHDWIVHLDDDDTWDTDHLQNILEGVRTGATFVTTWCQYAAYRLPVVHGVQRNISHIVPPRQCDTIHSSIAFNASKILTRYKRFPGHPADAVMWTRIVYDEGFYPAFVPVQSCYHLKERGGGSAVAIVRKSMIRDIDPPPGWHGEESIGAYHTLATNEFPPNMSPRCQYVVGPETAPGEQPSFRRLGPNEIPYHIQVVKEFANLTVWGKEN